MQGIQKFLCYALLLLFVLPSTSFAAPYGAEWYDVSEYLLGDVYVKVIFLESNAGSPNTEDWTEVEKANCREALEKALTEIRSRFIREFELDAGTGNMPPGVNLDFIVEYETVEVSVEPIQLNGSGIIFSRGDLKQWVNHVMAEKGFNRRNPSAGPQPLLPYPPYQYNVAEYADHLRNIHGTDWATVIFFYDNSEDEDGRFANKRSAGPPMGLGGPGLHFSNNRGQPFIERKKVLEDPASYIGLIHEFLHVWYAVDEHPANKHFREDAVIGYLGGQNLNYKKALGFNCSMYSANLYWPELCPFTKKQIGWTDSDGDHIPDILDVKPTVSLSLRPGKGPAVYTGTAVSPPLPNKNPYSRGGTIKPPYDLSVVLHLASVPEARLGVKKLFKKVPAFNPPFVWTRNDMTINEIVSVEYRIRQAGNLLTGWLIAEPKDGAYDEAVEDFTFSTETVDAGRYVVEVRSENSVHLYSDPVEITVDVGS